MKHNLLHKGFLTMLMEGKIYAENSLARKIIEYINKIFEDVGCVRYAKRLAKIRDAWRAASNQ